MEPRLPLTIAVAILGSALVAQPTLTSSNNIPIAGSDYPVNSGTYSYAGGTGPDQTYGFWALQSTGNRDIMYRSPAVTPTSAQVPTATLLSTDGGTDTLFWRGTAASLDIVAERSPLGLVVYTDPIVEISYPCTYGTTWSDALVSSYTAGGFPVNRAGTVNGHADGYGLLELPAAGMDDVLRVKVRKVITDQSAIVTVNRVSETYYFFSEAVPHPLLRLQIDTVIINNGTPTVQREALWMFGEGEVGMGAIAFDDVRFTAYPNPATDAVSLSLYGGGEARYVEVLDALGSLVLRGELAVREGEVPNAFNVSSLAPGVYHVRITGQKAVLSTRKLVVQ